MVDFVINCYDELLRKINFCICTNNVKIDCDNTLNGSM